MDRASRFLWEMSCGKKDQAMFKKAIEILCQVIEKTQDLTLITDGERRYGNFLFEICHEVFRNKKRGRPKKTLIKGVKIRIKNKGSQKHKRGRKRAKYQTPHPEHPETIQNIKTPQIQANRLEGFNASLRRKSAAYRRKTNTYAKNNTRLQQRLDTIWLVHNFVYVHFSTKQVPAVSIGILDTPLSFKDLFHIKFISN